MARFATAQDFVEFCVKYNFVFSIEKQDDEYGYWSFCQYASLEKAWGNDTLRIIIEIDNIEEYSILCEENGFNYVVEKQDDEYGYWYNCGNVSKEEAFKNNINRVVVEIY